MKGMRGGTGSFNAQQASLAAQEILEYSGRFERTLDRLRQKGCSIDDIGYYIVGDGRFSQYGTPPPNECNILHSAGGNMQPPTFLADGMLDAALPGWVYYVGGDLVFTWVDGIGTTDITDNSKDLLFWVRGVKKPICEKLNNALKVTPDLTVPHFLDVRHYSHPIDWSATTTMLSGDFSDKRSGCYFYGLISGINEYDFYYVVYSR